MGNSGGSLDDMVDELGIEILAEPEISSALSSLNQEMRKSGLNPLSNGAQFTAYFSAIYHYAGTTGRFAISCGMFSTGASSAWKWWLFISPPPLKSPFCCVKQWTRRCVAREQKQTDAVLESRWRSGASIALCSQAAGACRLCGWWIRATRAWFVLGGLSLRKEERAAAWWSCNHCWRLAPSCGADDISINIVKLIQKMSPSGTILQCVDGWTRNEQCRGIIGINRRND